MLENTVPGIITRGILEQVSDNGDAFNRIQSIDGEKKIGKKESGTVIGRLLVSIE